VKVIRITRLAAELPPDEAIDALAVAMEELAVAHALVIVHGPARGAERYLQAGGRVRFDDFGEPVLLWGTP
jgi:hypothetical protein